MQYVGIVRVIGVRLKNPVFEPDDERAMELLISVLIKDEAKTIIQNDLEMSARYGEVPLVGEMAYVMIKDKKFLLLD